MEPERHCDDRQNRATKPALHLPEEVSERLADGKGFLPRLQLDEQAPGEVARHAGDGADVDDGGAVDLPEGLGIEFLKQLLQ